MDGFANSFEETQKKGLDSELYMHLGFINGSVHLVQ
jgi:hypothetical protein